METSCRPSVSPSEPARNHSTERRRVPMLLVNPKINGSTTNVPNILNGLNRKATSLTVSGTIPIPPWFGLTYHYQGIAPYNGYGGPAHRDRVISATHPPRQLF